MAVKIAVTPKYEDEKRQIHSNRLLLYLLLKKLTALSDIFFNFGSYAPDCIYISSLNPNFVLFAVHLNVALQVQ